MTTKEETSVAQSEPFKGFYLPDPIHFAEKSAEVDTKGHKVLKEVASLLTNKFTEQHLVIIGYANKEVGDNDFKENLAENRANNALDLLINEYNIPKDRVFRTWDVEKQPFEVAEKNDAILFYIEEAIKNESVSFNSFYHPHPIHFSEKSVEVDSKGDEVLKELANLLVNEYQGETIRIIGHANKEVGDDDFRNNLAKNRAIKVADILVKTYKIPNERIEIDWNNDTQPFKNQRITMLSYFILADNFTTK